MRTRHPAVRRFALLALALVLAVLPIPLVAGTAHADGPVIAGTVSDGASGIPGAFVAVIGSAGQASAVTGPSGGYSIGGLADGTYTVSVHAQGYAVSESSVTMSGSPVGRSFVLVSSGARFRSTRVDGAQVGTVLSGGTPGVFYATTSVIPQIYRTGDYGGH